MNVMNGEGDLGISKSLNELTDKNDNNGDKIYGIIPYMTPEVFHEQDFTTALNIYSLSMIIWELMTGRRPFWDQDHDTELIIRICNNIRPPIVTNAPKGYIKLMKKCWHPDPNKRPTANYLKEVVDSMVSIEFNNLYNGKPFVDYQKHNLSYNDKSNFTDDLNDKNQGNKESRLSDYDYITKELEIDINANIVNINESNEEYLSREIDIDINLNLREF
ncbi:10008_t:CDS:2, partial [Funneliformis geosporum]